MTLRTLEYYVSQNCNVSHVGKVSTRFAIPLGLAEMGLGLGAELNSASIGQLSQGGYRSKKALHPQILLFRTHPGGIPRPDSLFHLG